MEVPMHGGRRQQVVPSVVIENADNDQVELADASEIDAGDVDDETLQDYAAELGIDAKSEPHLMWIAREGIVAKLEPPWKVYQPVGKPEEYYYYNPVTRESQWNHPADEKYREIVAREREKTAVAQKSASASRRRGKTPFKLLDDGDFGDRESCGNLSSEPSDAEGAATVKATKSSNPKKSFLKSDKKKLEATEPHAKGGFEQSSGIGERVNFGSMFSDDEDGGSEKNGEDFKPLPASRNRLPLHMETKRAHLVSEEEEGGHFDAMEDENDSIMKATRQSMQDLDIPGYDLNITNQMLEVENTYDPELMNLMSTATHEQQLMDQTSFSNISTGGRPVNQPSGVRESLDFTENGHSETRAEEERMRSAHQERVKKLKEKLENEYNDYKLEIFERHEEQKRTIRDEFDEKEDKLRNDMRAKLSNVQNVEELRLTDEHKARMQEIVEKFDMEYAEKKEECDHLLASVQIQLNDAERSKQDEEARLSSNFDDDLVRLQNDFRTKLNDEQTKMKKEFEEKMHAMHSDMQREYEEKRAENRAKVDWELDEYVKQLLVENDASKKTEEERIRLMETTDVALNALTEEHEQKIAKKKVELTADFDDSIQNLKRKHERECESLRQEHDEQLLTVKERLSERFRSEEAQITEDHQRQIRTMKQENLSRIQDIENDLRMQKTAAESKRHDLSTQEERLSMEFRHLELECTRKEDELKRKQEALQQLERNMVQVQNKMSAMSNIKPATSLHSPEKPSPVAEPLQMNGGALRPKSVYFGGSAK